MDDECAQLDHEYAQLDAPLLAMLGHDLMTEIIVALNGGKIHQKKMHMQGYLFPGYLGGHEVDFFEISPDAMKFWQHVCKYLRHSCTIYSLTKYLLLSDKEHSIDEHPCFKRDTSTEIRPQRYAQSHFFSGKPRPWMELRGCKGPQTMNEVLAIRDAVKDAVEAAWVAAKQAKIAARKARKKSLRSHYDEVLAIEASEEANIAAREARKQKRRAEVAVAVGEACAFKLSCAHVRS